ncbi:DUF4169 family protein [Sphingobium estronivorans]|uniref:DUF4169 family protein n=1 Tax=Sphingobium estronivorans TaxID=1577690 RepID=UPI00123C5766|nr:DUF4169 family protein [Sphingobium estronivorans]
MGDIINFWQARKTRARADKARQAEINRAKFGRTKAERQAEVLEEERKARLLDGAHLESPDKETE